MTCIKPTKACTISDLLNMILDKGAVISADIIISLAGIPLVGVKLNAAIAGIQTMLDYGMFEELASKSESPKKRALATEACRVNQVVFAQLAAKSKP